MKQNKVKQNKNEHVKRAIVECKCRSNLVHMGIAQNWYGIKRAHLFLENNKLNVCVCVFESVIFYFTATL